MHRPPLQNTFRPAIRFPRPHSGKAAFSLIEVTLAIGIIAFAFVALFGLLPTGLQTFRAAIDTSNETWILQSINSMVQTTDFAGIEDLGFEKSGEIFYYDEEAKLTDSEKHPGDDVAKRSRLYAVKIVTDKLNRPDGDSSSSNATLMNHGLRVIAVIAPVQDLKAMADFGTVKDGASLKTLPKQANVRTRTFFVARMDSQPLP